ncbi:MAG TPA: thioredoxin-dependent thiol peroxidase [Ignavibacteria bacterium]
MLKIGNIAPDFILRNEKGEEISFKDFKGKKVVLYFYPKDNTSGCTAEACDFKNNVKVFKKHNAIIIGISKDSVQSHLKFKEKFELPFTLLSDESTEVIKEYGVWKEKSMYGKKYFGIERTTFIIDENRIIEKIFQKVNVKGHVEEVLLNI